MIERKDDATRSVRTYGDDGVMFSERAYNRAENDALDARLQSGVDAENQNSVEANLAEDFDAMQAVIDQPNADLRADPSQEIKDIARAVRRLTRMALEDFTGTE